jgi:ubiquitin-protein ligase
MSRNMAKKPNDPYWLNPNDPRYWAHHQQRVREMHARLEEQSKPKSIQIELAWEDNMVVQEAIKRANTYCGTNDTSRALFHICQDYPSHGPHVRCLDNMAEKMKTQTDQPSNENCS